MSNEFKALTASESWKLLVSAARRAVEEAGYKLERQPGRGRSNVHNIKRNGKKQLASIRTTQDRWFAFVPGKDGWKTLDEVDVVIVAAVDDKLDPKNVEVFFFEADEVRQRFNDNYKARKNANHIVRDDFGLWVGLDLDERDVPASVGSGLAAVHKPIAVYPLSELMESSAAQTQEADKDWPTKEPQTIADVLSGASVKIAMIAGVDPSNVKLDLKIES